VPDKEQAYKRFMADVQQRLKFVDYASVITLSAQTRQRITKVFEEVDKVIEEREKRVPTAELNRVFEKLVAHHEPPLYRARRVKYYYVTQVAVKPPTFVVFVNYPDGVHFSYLRYIENNLRGLRVPRHTPKDFRQETERRGREEGEKTGALVIKTGTTHRGEFKKTHKKRLTIRSTREYH
jgi:GTP-binding protein